MEKYTVKKLTGGLKDIVQIEGKAGDWAPTGWAVMNNGKVTSRDGYAQIFTAKGTARAVADYHNAND